MLSQRWVRPGATRGLHAAALGLIVVLTCGLYLPFLDSPPVFDDKVFFSGERFAYYAVHPLGWLPRLPGYFSLALTEVFSGRIAIHRAIGLALHLACALSLYWLICELLQMIRRDTGLQSAADCDRRAAAGALFAAGAFAIHPVAVYGAGYLVQRSIVLATLFAVLSLLLLLYGLLHNRFAFTGAAAVLYALAVLSKEHSILLPAAALPIALLAHAGARANIRHWVLYLAGCAPAALVVWLMMRQLVGEAYEPHMDAITAQVEAKPGSDAVALTWPMSAVTQLGLFFAYLGSWLWPDTARMAIDLRIDPLATWSPAWIALKVGAFAATGALAFTLLWRKGRVGMIGLGVLFAWILFLVELSVARFQEPYVLYRSYLWAPGLAIALAAILDSFDRRITLVAFAALAPLLLYQAHDRLTTLSSPLKLWEDAAEKLPHQPVPWGSRILYNLGGEYLQVERVPAAVATIERCIAIYPRAHDCRYARGAIHFQVGEFEQALGYFIRAAEIDPRSGVTQHRIGLTLEKLGSLEKAKQHYRGAVSLGYPGGDMELGRLGASAAAVSEPTQGVQASP